jgi:hypothetical protein
MATVADEADQLDPVELAGVFGTDPAPEKTRVVNLRWKREADLNSGLPLALARRNQANGMLFTGQVRKR